MIAIRMTASEIEALDPYNFFAVLGKRVIHPGGRRSTEQLFDVADFRRRIRWLMPRMSHAAPFLGYIANAGRKPAGVEGRS